ncbi:hypothetical protein CPB86DRAFT_781964 [Serendipita vermifera]|nr:hypothetical protein CPB86DRAFT_781964 [Serendipita vermifera]
MSSRETTQANPMNPGSIHGNVNDSRKAHALRQSIPDDLEQRMGPGRYALYMLIIKSPFYIKNQLEPTLDSDEGKAMFREIDDWEILPGQRGHGKSIYYVFIEEGTKRCRFCGAHKGSLYRALACVRSHLDHRPFQCSGSKMGCRICGDEVGYKRFFSRPLLVDHISSQNQNSQCTHEGCNQSIRRGGMKRHWMFHHKDEPYPGTSEPL